MAIERIIPDCMKAQPSTETAGTAETARFENVKLNTCPVCQTPLRRSEANGVPVMICDAHAICMPTKDD